MGVAIEVYIFECETEIGVWHEIREMSFSHEDGVLSRKISFKIQKLKQPF